MLSKINGKGRLPAKNKGSIGIMQIIRAEKLKEKPADQSKLGFGKIFTDYMLTMRYKNGAWDEPRIEPYGPVAFDLATTVFHYAQGIFEGLKAFRNEAGEVRVFRPEENFKRMNRSAERMCIPQIDEKKVLEGMFELLRLEKDWIPTAPGTALYIRPSIIATNVALGVHASSEYLFFIILSPVGSYYAHGLAPTRLLVEDYYTRATVGGTGEAKCIANYAVSLKAGEEAEKKGFDQVLWLDANEKKYVEEVGSMNMFFVIDGEVVTPELVGSILPGITRKSSIELLRAHGYKVSERRVSIDEVIEAQKNGKLNEAFGTGTAAVISPVGMMEYKGTDYVVNGGEMGEITKWLYDTITGIQTGRLPDPFGWVVKL